MGIVSNGRVDQKVVDEAITLKIEFLHEQERTARQKILAALAKQHEFNLDSYPSEENGMNPSQQLLHHSAGANGPYKHGREKPDGTNELLQCCRRLWAIPRHQDTTSIPVIVPMVERLPPYTAWFPVYKSFLIKTPAETYLPFLGNSDKNTEDACKAMEIMEKEEGKKNAFDLPSDGEVDEKSGFFIPTGFLNEMVRTQTLEELRDRAAARHVIMKLIRAYGDGPQILNSLRQALQLRDTQVVVATFNLAEKRCIEGRKQKQTLKSAKRKKDKIEEALCGSWRSTESSYKAGTLRALFHFCFVCQEFYCDLHEEHRPVPVLPIPDESLKARLSDIGFEKPKPCSQSCYAARELDRSPPQARESEPWDDDELQLFRDAVLLFRKDACSISAIIGSRFCREVKRQLDAPKHQKWLQDAMDTRKEHEKVRTQVELMISAFDSPEDGDSCSDGDDEVLSVTAKKLKKSLRIRKQRDKRIRKPRKSSISPSEDTVGQWSCRPCNHVGDCGVTCSCVVNGALCESLCACNRERFTFSERLDRISVIGNGCSNRASFCECPGGNCDPLECPCSADQGKTCDPERCRCDSGIGPWDISLAERRCKNFQVLEHKTTRVGRSEEAGFGLFACEEFEKGDLIGPYIGAVLPAEIVDGTNAVGDITEKMYTFDIRNVTLDGTTLGAKVRFINHKEEWESPNCQAFEVRVRGHWFQRLIAIRAVEPGEEFFFDYKIVDPSTRDDCAYSLPTWLRDRQCRNAPTSG